MSSNYVAPTAAPKSPPPDRVQAFFAKIPFLPEGPKLQFLNLTILFLVIYNSEYIGLHYFGLESWRLPKIDYATPVTHVATTIALAVLLDGTISRYRFGEWRIPWPSMVASLGISLVLNGNGDICAGGAAVAAYSCSVVSWGPLSVVSREMWPFIILPFLMVGSKHLIRWRGRHLFNPNNFAAAFLLILFFARIGVNDWGAAPQTLVLMIFFGTISTLRVKRFDLAIFYLGLSCVAYKLIVGPLLNWHDVTTLKAFFSPLQVVIAFFAITDPATSPNGRLEKLLYAALLVLLGIPAMLAGWMEAPVFALFIAAPQRHFITYLVTGKWPTPPPAPGAKPSAKTPAGYPEKTTTSVKGGGSE